MTSTEMKHDSIASKTTNTSEVSIERSIDDVPLKKNDGIRLFNAKCCERLRSEQSFFFKLILKNIPVSIDACKRFIGIGEEPQRAFYDVMFERGFRYDAVDRQLIIEKKITHSKPDFIWSKRFYQFITKASKEVIAKELFVKRFDILIREKEWTNSFIMTPSNLAMKVLNKMTNAPFVSGVFNPTLQSVLFEKMRHSKFGLATLLGLWKYYSPTPLLGTCPVDGDKHIRLIMESSTFNPKEELLNNLIHLSMNFRRLSFGRNTLFSLLANSQITLERFLYVDTNELGPRDRGFVKYKVVGDGFGGIDFENYNRAMSIMKDFGKLIEISDLLQDTRWIFSERRMKLLFVLIDNNKIQWHHIIRLIETGFYFNSCRYTTFIYKLLKYNNAFENYLYETHPKFINRVANLIIFSCNTSKFESMKTLLYKIFVRYIKSAVARSKKLVYCDLIIDELIMTCFICSYGSIHERLGSMNCQKFLLCSEIMDKRRKKFGHL